MLNGIILKTVAGFLAATTASLGSPIPTAIAGDSQVKISWAPPTPTQQIFGVEVEESLDDSVWFAVAKLPPTSTRVSVQNLTNGKNYWFRVRWIWLDSSLGIPSPTLVAIPINIPVAPSGLVATPSADQVGLSWDKDPNKSIVGYEIDQSIDDGNTWRTIKANTGSPSNGFLVNNLAVGKTYTYRIRAIGFAGVQSEYSASADAKVAAAPTGGYALNYAIKNSKVTLTWDTPADLTDVQTYDVNVSGDGGINWYKVATVQGGTNTAIVPYVIGGSAYQIIATSSSDQTSSSQVQLVESNIVPDSLQTPDPAPDPNSTVASPSPTLSPNPLSAASSSNSPTLGFLLGIVAVVSLIIGGSAWALISSNKKKNSKYRYKSKPRKPYKKKVTKKKKSGR